MEPDQSYIMMSSLFAKPSEQEPSPVPFSPFSNSSNKRKFLGTLVAMFLFASVNQVVVERSQNTHNKNANYEDETIDVIKRGTDDKFISHP
jgi:hypothetical protein